ncbi:MAG: hypothetical protein Q8Q95_04445 [bacterium]|nr:hypothetical protein [bacterium]
MKSYKPQEWYNLIKDLHGLIIEEINTVFPDTLPELYPKLVAMYEFFRLVRGEAFNYSRPADMGNFQKEIYKMEDELKKHLKQLENKLDVDDEKTSYNLDLMKKMFSLKYFNQD